VTRDDLRDALALVGAALLSDEEGQRVIRENADPDGLVDGLLTVTLHAVRLMARIDGVPDTAAIAPLQAALRDI
jgi:hypothetical protein